MNASASTATLPLFRGLPPGFFPLLLAVGVLCSCKSDRSPAASEDDESSELSAEVREASIERGNAAAAALMKNLSTQLKAALSSGGPEQAIVVCQQAALPITETTAKQFEGLQISRTSLKTRNPANAPTDRDREVLQAWQSLHDAGKDLPPHVLERVGPDRVIFYKPIMIQELCLQCHGDRESMDAGLRDRLAELYSDDQAHGYAVGELRGAFRVEMSR